MDNNQTSQRSGPPIGWLILGMALGAALMFAFVNLRAPAASAPIESQPFSAEDIRSIIREEVGAALKDAAKSNPAASAAVAGPPVPTAAPQATLGSNVIGDANAPVTMIEYSDFQCPFCGRFQKQVYPALLEKYVKTGKVKVAYKHFAFLGQESFAAAQASECAAEQNKFWDFHDTLFARQNGENQGAFNKDNLLKFAADVKLDVKAFTECLDSGRMLERVQKDVAEGRAVGVRGTPHFLINGKAFVGAQPVEAFQQAIDDALKGSK